MISGNAEHLPVESRLLSPLFRLTHNQKVLSVFIAASVNVTLFLSVITCLLEAKNLSRCHRITLNANWFPGLILLFGVKKFQPL